MTGAAGGLAGGLWAAFGAELVPGAAFVLDAIGFDARMRAARAVVAGEGRLDQQSLAGKALSEVATRARQAGVPCHAIVGSNELDSFGLRILDLQVVLEAGTPDRAPEQPVSGWRDCSKPSARGPRCASRLGRGVLGKVDQLSLIVDERGAAEALAERRQVDAPPDDLRLPDRVQRARAPPAVPRAPDSARGRAASRARTRPARAG